MCKANEQLFMMNSVIPSLVAYIGIVVEPSISFPSSKAMTFKPKYEATWNNLESHSANRMLSLTLHIGARA